MSRPVVGRVAASPVVVLAGLALLLGLLTGCADRAPTLPTRGQLAPPTPTETQGPGDWEAEFSSADLAEYAEALARWEEYQAKAGPIYREGRATAASRALFAEFFFAPDVMQAALEQSEAREVKVIGEVQVLWSRARSVERDDRGVGVVIEQCINVARTSIVEGVRTMQSPHRLPILRVVSMASLAGAPYRVFAYEGPENGKIAGCEQ